MHKDIRNLLLELSYRCQSGDGRWNLIPDSLVMSEDADVDEDTTLGSMIAAALVAFEEGRFAAPDIEKDRKRRIKTTDSLGNVRYLTYSLRHGWRCTLANGTPASLSYAVGYCKDVMGLHFRLDDAAGDEERLQIVRNAAPRYKVEFV